MDIRLFVHTFLYGEKFPNIWNIAIIVVSLP